MDTPFSGWTVFWLIWGAAMLADIAAALVRKKRTFSEHIWGRWFDAAWKRTVFLVFWATVGIHFAFAGQHWFASGGAVLVTAAPVAVLILWRERILMRKVFGAIWNGIKKAGGGLKSAGTFVLRRGPLVSALISGAAIAFPAAAPVLGTIGGLLSGATGGTAVTDPEVIKSFSELLAGGLLFIGSLRKFWALAKPLVNPPDATPAK